MKKDDRIALLEQECFNLRNFIIKLQEDILKLQEIASMSKIKEEELVNF